MSRLKTNDLKQLQLKQGFSIISSIGGGGGGGGISPSNKGESSVMECSLSARTLGAAENEKGNTGRVLIRITSFRLRLIDEDNLCEKYIVDCCRYSGLLPDDNPEQTKIEVCQEKVRTKEEERTLVQIFDSSRF